MPKTVCVANMREGVGKTTLSVNLAWCAVLRGSKTLVVDLDPQADASAYLMGAQSYLKHIDFQGLTVYDIFEESSPDRDPHRANPSAMTVICRQVAIPWGAKKAIHVIPSQPELSYTLNDPGQKAELLSTFLKIEAAKYDLIIIDTPPMYSMATEAAYLASDYVLIPVKPEHRSSIGFNLLKYSISSFKENHTDHQLDVVGIVLMNVDESLPAYNITRSETVDWARGEGYPLLDQQVHFSRAYFKEEAEGGQIFGKSYSRWDVATEFKSLGTKVLTTIGL